MITFTLVGGAADGEEMSMAARSAPEILYFMQVPGWVLVGTELVDPPKGRDLAIYALDAQASTIADEIGVIAGAAVYRATTPAFAESVRAAVRGQS